ncbi:MAG TPA: tripartite tricarboxylate transporter permease, partial [archaeon]|nr:tripartite tricarboxylate transporter permease [archaeon]
LSYLLLQGTNTKIPKQTLFKAYVPEKKSALSVIKGSLGGIISGFLPGVGSSQIASFFATSEHKDENYIITIGAIAWSNLFLSILSLWLIDRPRSGIAVAVSSVTDVNFSVIIYIIITLVAATAIAALITLFIAKNSVKRISEINYRILNRLVICTIIIVVAAFTGFVGLFLLFVCTALGIYANTASVKRSIMMSVLIIPTILFYIGV